MVRTPKGKMIALFKMLKLKLKEDNNVLQNSVTALLVWIHLASNSRVDSILTFLVHSGVVVRGADDLLAAMFTQWVSVSWSSLFSKFIWWPGLSRRMWCTSS